MKALLVVIMALSVPLIILEALGAIVSGIWLAIVGEWGAVGLGILSFFVSTSLLRFALKPSMLLLAPSVYYAEREKTLGFLCFGMLSNLYVSALITVWCCGILFLFVRDASESTLIPRLIWSYGAAIGPWAYLSTKSSGREGSAADITTFLAALAYLVIMLLLIFVPITLFGAVTVFGGFMLAGLALLTTFTVMARKTLTVMILNEQKRFAAQPAQPDEWGTIESDSQRPTGKGDLP